MLSLVLIFGFCVAGPVAWTVSHWTFRTYIVNFHKRAQDIFSHVLTSLTDCFAEYEEQTLYGTFVVTLSTLLRLIYSRFIININIIIISAC